MPTTGTGRPPLTTSDVLALAAIVTAAREGAPVARIMPDGHPAAGEVVYGVARHIVTDEHAMLACGLDDVRDCYLRVTGGGIGLDHFWPVAELMSERRTGEFCVNVPHRLPAKPDHQPGA